MSRTELVAVVFAAIVLAVATHWALIPRLASDLPQELRDPLLQSWQVAWDGHAFATSSTPLFDSNTFWPLDNSLAFSDALLGYAPAGLIGEGVTAAVVRYNLLFLFSYVLAFVGAYLLAREMGAGPFGATIAAIAFAYAPWRLAQDRHLHVISSGGVPLSLMLLSRGYRLASPRWIVAGWLVVAWQLSLGFTLGLQLGYLLVVLAVIVAIRWLIGERQRPPRAVVAATALGVVLLGAWAAYQARPYIEVVEAHPEARRSVAQVRFFSPPPDGFLAAPSESYLWGDRTAPRRRGFSFAQEQVLFPGVVVTALAIGGLLSPVYRRSVRAGLFAAVVIAGVLSLGFRLEDGAFGYAFMYDNLPGWQGIRTPGRLHTITSLGLALLACGGAQWLFRPSGARTRPGSLASWGIATVVVAAVLAEGVGRLDHHAVPQPPPALASVEGPRLHLPTDDFYDALYMLWSTEGWPSVVNGVSGFTPTAQARLRQLSLGFPDRASVGELRELGIENVVLHDRYAIGFPWERVDGRPVSGLGIAKRVHGELTVFDLDP